VLVESVGLSARAKVVVTVLGISLGSGALGAVAATQLRSPADAAADTEAPDASRITIEVEQRALSSDVILRGDVRFDDAVAIRIPAGEGAVVTGPPPAVGTALAEGQPVIEVAERPVFVLAGTLPMYRDVLPGTSGDDVGQLEAALARLGYDPGPLDAVWDPAAEAALTALYVDRGYPAPLPAEEDALALDAAADAVTAAQQALRSARSATGAGGTPASAVLAAEAAFRQAQGEVDVATARAAEAGAVAAAAVVDARNAYAGAGPAAATARARLAQAEGGAHPDTGQAPTSPELAELRSGIAEAEAVLAGARSSLIAAEAALGRVDVENRTAIQAAVDAVAVARAQLAEARRPSGDDPQAAVRDANEQLAQAQAELAEVDSRTGVVAPKAELVFVPTLPAAMTAVNVNLGDAVGTEPLAEISGASLVVDAAVSAADRSFVAVGDPVLVEEDSLGISAPGVVAEVADEPGGSAGDGRYRMVVSFVGVVSTDLRGVNVKLTIPVDATEGEVLAVPIAALSATGDGDARVEVEDVPDEPTRFVAVSPGLSADGMVEVTPADGDDLRAGDLVVVGARSPDGPDDAGVAEEPGADESPGGGG
jgi:predicted RNA-binding protein with TRAM domain/peptidoglycan hydrolase-like protein with peptidoglycan-binding domain